MADTLLNEDWDDEDDKKNRGKIDRVSVSLTEPYEVEHFIDAYLKRRGVTDNKKNRDLIDAKMRQYPGRAPIQRKELNDWLDQQLQVKK